MVTVARQIVWEAVIGLEIHAQIATRTKLFSAAEFSSLVKAPNSCVALLDAAFPGSLPILNRHCVEKAVLTGLSLGGRVNKRSSFDRKHYFYADQPAGFQITQHRSPLITGGAVELTEIDGLSSPQTVRLQQIQLEQDTGKSMYDPGFNATLVDLNRSGAALMEVVTFPDIRSGIEAAAFIKQLQANLRAIGASHANMEDGSIRCDVNVSVRQSKDTSFGTRVEIKNLNSVRSVVQAIDWEISRHIELLTRGEVLEQETRTFDVNSGQTIKLRSKEEARDYRYMPEPDLPDLILTEEEIDQMRNSLPELPAQRINRMNRSYNIGLQNCKLLLDEPGGGDYYEETLAFLPQQQQQQQQQQNHLAMLVMSWVSSELLGVLNAKNMTLLTSPVTPQQLASIVRSIDSGLISGKLGKAVLQLMVNGDHRLSEEIATEKGWRQINDEDLLSAAVDRIVNANADKVASIASNHRVFGWFVGQVMKETKGQAKPELVTQLLKKRIGQL